jgi:hypothetical protein
MLKEWNQTNAHPSAKKVKIKVKFALKQAMKAQKGREV